MICKKWWKNRKNNNNNKIDNNNNKNNKQSSIEMSSHTNNHLQIKKIKIKIATEWKHFIIIGNQSRYNINYC